MAVDYFKADYPELSKELTKVQKLMKKAVVIKNESIQSAIFDLLNSGGKMLRPAYLLMFSDLVNLEEDLKLHLAAAVEMLHTATLIHDDVIDKADSRRGVATISSRYGVDSAVYAGDYLFIVAMKLLSTHATALSNLTEQLGAMERLINGEIGQMNKRFDLSQSIDDYLENIRGKTAELFALSCLVGPMVSGDKKLAKNASSIGRNVGIAFQVMDDYLDYASSRDTLGKPVLEDIKQGVYSAPVLYALQLEPMVAEAIRRKDFAAVYNLVHTTGALEKTKELAAEYTGKALRSIKKLPAGEVREKLYNITEKLLERVL